MALVGTTMSLVRRAAAPPRPPTAVLADAVAERVKAQLDGVLREVRHAAQVSLLKSKVVLTTREAALYCGYVADDGAVTTDGIRSAVRDGKLTPCGSRGGGQRPRLWGRR
jgi:hypothetical protein